MFTDIITNVFLLQDDYKSNVHIHFSGYFWCIGLWHIVHVWRCEWFLESHFHPLPVTPCILFVFFFFPLPSVSQTSGIHSGQLNQCFLWKEESSALVRKVLHMLHFFSTYQFSFSLLISVQAFSQYFRCMCIFCTCGIHPGLWDNLPN